MASSVPNDQCNTDAFYVCTKLPIICKTMHVSCSSHGWEAGQDYGGLVFYHLEKRDEFSYGGRRMKCGYIVIGKSLELKKMRTGIGQIHGDCFKVRIIVKIRINDRLFIAIFCFQVFFSKCGAKCQRGFTCWHVHVWICFSERKVPVQFRNGQSSQLD